MSGRDRIRRLAQRLSDRDIQILVALREFRLMTGEQIRRWFFPDGELVTQARKTRAALRRLTEVGVINRLDRRVGGIHAGSDGYVYAISGWGQAVLDMDTESPRRHRRVIETKPAFGSHALAISALAVQLHEHQHAGDCEVEELRAEPGAWRWFSGIGGGSRVLKPDAYVRLAIGEFVLSAFIELDQATESLPTILRKLHVYVDYWRSGIEQQARGVFPLVWWLVPSDARLTAIARTITRLPDEAHQLFTVALQESAAHQLTQLQLQGGAT